MTTQVGNRFALSRVALLAMAETRLAAQAVPGVIRYVAPICAWAAISIALGAIVGFAAVALPPMGAFGIVGAVGLVLLWALPEVTLVYPVLIRKTFFVMLAFNLCVPYYYMVQVGGLPWISARRFTTFALVVPLLLAIASSSHVRRLIVNRARPSLPILICAAGYLSMAVLSTSTSDIPSSTLSSVIEAILSWYLPFIAVIYIMRDKDDAIFILKIVCVCGLVNTAAGMLEFRMEHNFFIDVFPRGMLESMIENNPALQGITTVGPSNFRNGLYRAASIFVAPLSFGEFEIILIPIGLFFASHRRNWFERCLGWAVVIGGAVGIFISGSRGAYAGFFASTAAFAVIWSIRKALNNRASFAPALVGLTAAISFAIVIVLINVWPKAHNVVLGGGAEAASNNGRWVQWAAALPLIKSNPITGHGFGHGGFNIDMSIDSYVISLLLETGVPGLVFFAGIACLPIWYGIRAYLSDMSESGALAGALACSFIAFTVYRIFLSQRENHTLVFCLMAIVVVLNYEYQSRRANEPRSYRAQRRT